MPVTIDLTIKSPYRNKIKVVYSPGKKKKKEEAKIKKTGGGATKRK